MTVKITDVRCFTLHGNVIAPLIEERQVGMLDVYAEFAARPFTPRKTDVAGSQPDLRLVRRDRSGRRHCRPVRPDLLRDGRPDPDQAAPVPRRPGSARH